MRIEELLLERYGHFDGLRLDLSGDGVLLHVIYGPNEAGKSTALTGICDLLFGIPARTPYNFRHEYGALRIGATLSNTAGQTLSFKRRKANADTLLSINEDRTLSDNSLVPFLGGASREFFERMYGLNHERLRSGGKAMLQAGGDIAQSLFEAGSGLAGLSSVAKKLTDEADAIGSPGARKAASKPYWRAHERYEQAASRIKADALKADVWKEAERKLSETEARLRELQELVTNRARKRSALERARRVAPILKRIDDIAAELTVLGGGVLLPEHFAETWREANQAVRDAEAEVARATRDLERHREELRALGAPGLWPSMAARIEELSTDLGDYRIKCRDLPHRLQDLENDRKRIAELLGLLGTKLNPDQAAGCLPSPMAVARVRELISGWNRLDQKLASACEEAEKAATALREANQELQDVGSPRDPSIAVSAVDAASAYGDTTSRHAKAQQDLDAAREDLDAAMSSLGRWTGGAAELVSSPFPSVEDALRLERQLQALDDERKAIEESRGRLRDELSRIDGELAMLQATGEVPTEDVLRSVRERRDHGWRLIRREFIEGAETSAEQLAEFAPDGDIAETFEKAVATADQVADGREREAGRIERFAHCTGQREKARQDLELLGAREERLSARSEAWDREWQALWSRTGIAPGTPTEMRAWIARKDDVVLKYQAVRAAQRTVKSVEDDADLARSHLLAAATELGLGDVGALDLASLRRRVGAALAQAKDHWSRADEVKRKVTDCRRTDAERRFAVEQIEANLTKWQAAWAKEIPGLGIPVTASTKEAEAALNVWQEIGTVLANTAQTRHRRDQMKEVIEAYEAEARALLAELGDGAADLDSNAECASLVPVLRDRLAAAQQLAARVNDCQKRMRLSEKALDDAEEQVKTAERELRTLRDLNGLTEDADVITLAQASDRRRVLVGSRDIELKALAEQGDGQDESALRAAVADIDIDEVAAEIERLNEEIERLNGELQLAAQAVAVAEKELEDLQRREGIGAAAQEANDAAAEMIAHVERWLRLKAANIILGRAVERYREANQNPLVRRASEIFAAIAGSGDDPIVRLSVDYTDETKPVLVGYRRDGRQCPVSGMSDGTLDQLYLALRIAAVEQHIASSEPLPFIADDLFITSDEERTVPGIKALAELGRRTQVLLFTHHRYVVDAAEKALKSGKLRVHSLRPDVPRLLEAVE